MKAPPFAQYRRKWDLVADGSLSETPTSWLMPVRQHGQPAMLKILKRTSDERAAASLLRYFAGSGAVQLIAADDDSLLMERAVDDVSLRTMAISGGDAQAAEILADCVQRLHAPRDHPAPRELTALRDWFRSLFARQTELPILSHCADVARLENPWPHGELVHQPDRMMRLTELYATRLGLELRRVLGFAFAHAGLAASWLMDDGSDPSYRLQCAKILEPLVRGHTWS